MQKVFTQTSFPVNYQKLHRSLEEGKEINGNVKWSMWCGQLLQVLKFSFPHTAWNILLLQVLPSPPLFFRQGESRDRGSGEECVLFVFCFFTTFTLRVPHSKSKWYFQKPSSPKMIWNNKSWVLKSDPCTLTHLKIDLQANYFNPMTRNMSCSWIADWKYYTVSQDLIGQKKPLPVLPWLERAQTAVFQLS